MIGFSLDLSLPIGLQYMKDLKGQHKDPWFRKTWGVYKPSFFLVSFWIHFLHTTSYKINFHLSYFPCPNPFQCNVLGWLTPRWTFMLHLASLIGAYREICISPILPFLISSSDLGVCTHAAVPTQFLLWQWAAVPGNISFE